MNIWVDKKYAGQLSLYLVEFKQLQKNVWNFRCPICGDSKKKKFKKRGYLFEHKGTILFKCHNCGNSLNLYSFIKLISTDLAREYLLEVYCNDKKETELLSELSKETHTNDINIKHDNELLKPFKKLADLKISHRAVIWAKERLIPEKYFSVLRFTNNYSVNIENNPENKYSDERIIIPFNDSSGELLALQGRAIYKQGKLRYKTTILKGPKIFGVDSTDITEDVFITEGPIDSMFLNNSVAVAGASSFKIVDDYIPKDKQVFIFDNEPRNPDIIKMMKTVLIMERRLVILPRSLPKDINDMVLKGHNVEQIVRTNIVSGITGNLKLQEWRR